METKKVKNDCCNNYGECSCSNREVSNSVAPACSAADRRKATILGAFGRLKGYKVGDNPYGENDPRHWAWMQGWAEVADVQF